MVGLYVLKGRNITVANAAVTLAILHTKTSGKGSVVEILRAWASQHASATSAQQPIMIMQKASAFGTYVSATPTPLNPGDDASAIVGGTAGAAGTAGINASAEGAGTETEIIPDAFNVLTAWTWLFTPEERIKVGPDLAIALKFPAAPATLTGWNFGFVYREVT
jgi:hypothetical protein